MQRDPWLKALIVLLVIIAASYLAGLAWSLAVRFADIVLLLVLAWVLAFALEPVTHFVQACTRVSRAIAVAIVYAGLLVVLTLATLLVVPVIALQISQIGMNLSLYVTSVGTWLVEVQAWLSGRGLAVDIASLLDYRETARRIESLGPTIVNNALTLATGVASVLFSMVLVIMFSFYMMLDRDRLNATFLQAVPASRRDEINYLIFSTHRAFGGYIRGQLVQALVYSIGTAGIMLSADLTYTAVAAVFAFGIMMIPFIGPVLAIIPPVIIAMFVHPERVWWVFLLLLLLQQVVFNVLAPRVMSKSVGIHPLLVLLALLAGANLAGVWGAIFAIPVAGVIVAMIAFYRMSMAERELHLKAGTLEAERGEATSPQLHQQPGGRTETSHLANTVD